MPLKDLTDFERVLIAISSLALTCPSAYTIAWSKQEHKEQVPILYAGIATSAATVVGAILGKKWHGDTIMWGGLVGTLGLFGYVTFIYKPSNTVPAKAMNQQNQPVTVSKYVITA